ncbi:hypothetical protein [Senegalimassilia anaerobia]|uniref:hypothetical protein n=1 Tax=Senegalimassilia anaerobia TaxID=1473216 RepID=UPI003A93BC3D
MLRKNIVKQLREVADTARKLQEFNLENIETGERIEIDPVIAKHLITSTLAYAVLLVNGKTKRKDPDDVIASIIATACMRYADEK